MGYSFLGIMNIKYDKESNAAYLTLETAKIVDSEEIQPNVVFDYDESDRVVGIEFLNMSQPLLLSENDAQKFVEITQNLPLLNPSQIRVGSKKVMPYKERLSYLKNSKLGELYGFKQQQ